MTQRTQIALFALAVLLMSLASLSAFAYAWRHPGMTATEVLQAAGEWALPWRWFR